MPKAAPSIAALTVLFNNSPVAIEAALESISNAARVARDQGVCSRFAVALGDASPASLFSDADLDRLRDRLEGIDLKYVYFNENTGTSKGQNKLATLTESDLVLLCNPDVQPEGQAIARMLAVLANDDLVGLVEAKQLPVEHPRDYDPTTGVTSWGSGAFSLVRRALFEEIGGFDQDTFFLYCDDVDLSWRIRETGHEVVHQPAAIVFHEKSLSSDAGWIATDAEHYYSAEAALLLAHKWSRDDILDGLLSQLRGSAEAVHHKAVEEFERRVAAGALVPRRDPQHAVGTFIDGNYAKHRFTL